MNDPIADAIRHAPPGSLIELEIGTATATGSGITSNADDFDGVAELAAPTADAKTGQASAGGASQTMTGTAWGGGDALASILLWAGVALAVAAAGAWWAGLRRLAVHLVIVAGALIVAGLYPVFALFALLAAVGLAIGPQAIADYKARRLATVAERLVRGVEVGDDPATKSAIRKELDAADDRAIQPMIRKAEKSVKGKA